MRIGMADRDGGQGMRICIAGDARDYPYPSHRGARRRIRICIGIPHPIRGTETEAETDTGTDADRDCGH